MPEIWLPYGAVEVPIDIKAENLAEVLEPIYPDFKPNLNEYLERIEYKGKTLIFVCDVEPALVEVVESIIVDASKKGLKPDDLIIMAPKQFQTGLRKIGEKFSVRVAPIGTPSLSSGIADSVPITVPKEFANYQNKILVSTVGFDPLFGFKGGPVSFLKCINEELMREAFIRRSSDSPKPGEDTDAAWFASRVMDQAGDFLSIEVLPFGGRAAVVFIGKVGDAHANASKSLIDSAKKSLSDATKGVIASVGGIKHDGTLASSLKVLSNLGGGVKDGGVIALLAECTEGLGSQALRLLVSGRLNLSDVIKRGEYIEGLEDLLYLKEILQKNIVILVSSLPNYYVESKLRMRVAGKSNDALTYILSNFGTRTKIHIIPKARETLITIKSEKGALQ